MGIFETIRTANHNLLRNKARTILTVIAIFIGSFTIILNAAINSGVNAFIDDQAASLGGEDCIMIMAEGSVNAMGAMMGGSDDPVEYNPNQTLSALTDDELAKLKTIEGIDADNIYVAKQLAIEYVSSSHTDKKYNITVGAMPPGDFTIATTAGHLPEQDTNQYEITLQAGYPEALGFASDEDALGQTITLTTIDPVTKETKEFTAKIVGVQAKGIVAVNGSIISRVLEDAIHKELTKNYPPDMAETAYAVQTRFDTSKYTEDEIKQILKDNGFYGMTVSDMMGAIRSFFDVIMIVFTIFGGIALLAAAIGIVNTLLMSVEERTREIGLDKALGMSSGKIFLNFSFEAISLGFWGSFFGVAIAMVVGNIVNFVVHQPGGFLEVFPTFHLFNFSIITILPIVLVIMLIAFIAGTIPAWKAAHKNPIDALRYE